MFDSNGNINNILFKQEFDNWSKINQNLHIIHTINESNQDEHSVSTTNDWKGEYGRIDKAMILKYADTNTINNSIFYICSALAC